MIHIKYNYGPGVRGTTTQRRPKSNRRKLVALVGLPHFNIHLLNARKDIDAAITAYFFFPQNEEKEGPKSDFISFNDFFRSKYQMNIDGTVAAYRNESKIFIN